MRHTTHARLAQRTQRSLLCAAIMLLCLPAVVTADDGWHYIGHGLSQGYDQPVLSVDEKSHANQQLNNGVSYYIKRSSIKPIQLNYGGIKNRYRTALTKMRLDKPVYADGKRLTLFKEVMFFDCHHHKSVVHTVAGFTDDASRYVTSTIINVRSNDMPFRSYATGSVGHKAINMVCNTPLS